MATWTVDDITRVVSELTANGVEFVRREGLQHHPNGVAVRAGGGHIACSQDPDDNTFAVESNA